MIYSNVMTTMRYTFIQFVLYLVTSVIVLILSNILTQRCGIIGASIAYFVIMFILFTLYTITEKIILNKEGKNNG